MHGEGALKDCILKGSVGTFEIGDTAAWNSYGQRIKIEDFGVVFLRCAGGRGVFDLHDGGRAQGRDLVQPAPMDHHSVIHVSNLEGVVSTGGEGVQ